MNLSLGYLVPLSNYILNEGRMIRDNKLYQVYDYEVKNTNFSASLTVLKPEQMTTGHSHPNEQFYFFVTGCGVMQLDDNLFPVKPLSFVAVPPNAYHRIKNTEKKHTLNFVDMPVIRDDVLTESEHRGLLEKV